jgi:hypothetical protein
MEEQMKGNPDPSGNIEYYNSIEEKVKKCREMAGYNESLKPSYYRELNKEDRR